MKKAKLLLFGVVLAALLALPGTAMAKSRDRDHDKMPDKWEKRFGLSTHRNNAKGDRDRDGLRNLAEFRMHTNPRDADTDGDGVKDGNEPSGTVDSFVEDAANPGTGVLTIRLPDNSTVSGQVTRDTEIECENEQGDDEQGDGGDRHDREVADDNSGPGSGDDSGDDGPNHDVNEQTGDDDGDNNDENENEGNCTTADLTPGAVVPEAELRISGGQAVFEEVELQG
jgi:hypothetical protein